MLFKYLFNIYLVGEKYFKFPFEDAILFDENTNALPFSQSYKKFSHEDLH